jgi:Golgi apparatus protein 1
VAANCEADIDSFCYEAKNKLRGNATVLKCLVDNFKSITDACQSELSRAVRLALWDYKPGAGFTMTCDKDVNDLCPKVRSKDELKD